MYAAKKNSRAENVPSGFWLFFNLIKKVETPTKAIDNFGRKANKTLNIVGNREITSKILLLSVIQLNKGQGHEKWHWFIPKNKS